MARAGGDLRARRPRRQLRRAAVRRGHGRAGQRRAAAARRRSKRRRSRRSCCSSTSSGPRSTTIAPKSCCGRRARPRAPLPAHDPPLPPASAHRARGEDATEKSVTGRDAWTRLFSELTRAVEVDLADEDEPVQLDVALSRLMSPDRELRAARPRRSPMRSRRGCARGAFIFNTLLHDKSIDDRLRSYPSWISSRNLSNEASDESVAGAGGRGARQLRHPAALVPPEGAACSASTGSRTTTAWRRSPTPTRVRVGRGQASSCSASFGDFSDRARPTPCGSSSTSTGSTRRRGPASAAARSAPTPCRRPPLRAAQLHRAPPRRADARPRARPRRARRARAAARRLRAAHAADARRDRVGVRRDARLRPAARRRPSTPESRLALLAEHSRARSPPSSARSR